jgi:hypothetical protein
VGEQLKGDASMCDERERLIDYLYGESGAEERQDVSRHVAACQTCRNEIGGLQSVREDLLAWDVPEHGSVWTPFAPARVTPWWREVPAWAMAAAASLTFVVGAAGGVATHAYLGGEPVVAAMPAVVQAPVVPADITRAEYADLIRRLQMMEVAVGDVRTLGQAINASALVSAPQPQVRPADGLSPEVVNMFTAFNNDLARTTAQTNRLSRDVQEMRTVLVSGQVSGPGRQ